MSTYWRYACLGYFLPVAWWLAAELFAWLYGHQDRFPTFTRVVTEHLPQTILMGATIALFVWLKDHWRVTYESIKARLAAKEREKRRAERKARRAARREILP